MDNNIMLHFLTLIRCFPVLERNMTLLVKTCVVAAVVCSTEPSTVHLSMVQPGASKLDSPIKQCVFQRKRDNTIPMPDGKQGQRLYKCMSNLRINTIS